MPPHRYNRQHLDDDAGLTAASAGPRWAERPFADRRDAGRKLARQLRSWGESKPVVIGIARGGLVVAYEVARQLDAPLDLTVVRKIGAPGNPEFAIGALAEDGSQLVDEQAVSHLGVTPGELTAATAQAQRELAGRLRRYRTLRPAISVQGRVVLLIDDGLATGSSARAAVQYLRRQHPARIIVAAPVGSREAVHDLADVCDEVECLLTPEPMLAVGYWYEAFDQTSDAEVAELLSLAQQAGERRLDAASRSDAAPPIMSRSEPRIVTTDGAALHADLTVPSDATGIVLFAHGSGSSRHSPRNREVAGVLQHAGLATLLLDLLTPHEELRRANVFDVELLANRLLDATRWIASQPALEGLGIGYFGASTGAGAALWAAAEAGDRVQAVVARGGRPDLAGERLSLVRAPTLLIVGGADPLVLDLNRRARAQMTCEAELDVVPGATHLFEEPGALDTVARLARDWLKRRLTAVAATAKPG